MSHLSSEYGRVVPTRWSIADTSVEAQIMVISYGTGPLVTDSEIHFLVTVLLQLSQYECTMLMLRKLNIEYSSRVSWSDKPSSPQTVEPPEGSCQ